MNDPSTPVPAPSEELDQGTDPKPELKSALIPARVGSPQIKVSSFTPPAPPSPGGSRSRPGVSQQCPPRRGWAGTAAGSWHTHSTVEVREARRVPEEVTLPTYTGLCPSVCATWPVLGSTGDLTLPSSLSAFRGVPEREIPGPEKKRRCCSELGRDSAR